MTQTPEEIRKEIDQNTLTRSQLAATIQQTLINQTIVPFDIKDDKSLINLYQLSLKLADAVIESIAKAVE